MTTYKIADSGEREEFPTGAVRDTDEGKGHLVYNTNLQEKKAHFEKFVELIKNQFWHGGDKYMLSDNKEVADWVCEIVPGDTGIDWILGTCAKYIGRFKNFKREKDLLKVATYMYIAWIKMGFHLKDKRDEDTEKL